MLQEIQVTTDYPVELNRALYFAAQDADRNLSRVCDTLTNGRRNRFQLTKAEERSPEFIVALEAKIAADRAWLNFLRERDSLGVTQHLHS